MNRKPTIKKYPQMDTTVSSSTSRSSLVQQAHQSSSSIIQVIVPTTKTIVTITTAIIVAVVFIVSSQNHPMNVVSVNAFVITEYSTRRNLIQSKSTSYQQYQQQQSQLHLQQRSIYFTTETTSLHATIATENGQSPFLNDGNNNNENSNNSKNSNENSDNGKNIELVEEDDEDEEEEELDDDDDDDEEALISTESITWKDQSQQLPMQQPSQLQQQQQQQQFQNNVANNNNNNNMLKLKKKKNKNRAMSDPQFVRKRTNDLITAAIDIVTSPYTNYNDIDGNIYNANYENCIVPDDDNDTEDCIPDNGSGNPGNGRTNTGNNNNNINVIGKNMRVEKKTFHFLIDAWAFSGEDDAAEQAIRLLECMETCYRTIVERYQLSSSNSYNDDDTLVQQLPSQIIQLLQLQPDVRSFTKTMNAIARRADINAGIQADVLFQRMKNNECQPNSYTYTALIQAHAAAVSGSTVSTSSTSTGSIASNSANEQLQLLIKRFELEYIQLIQMGVSTTSDSVLNIPQPTAKAFHAVMRSYSKIGQVAYVENILYQMEQLYTKYGPQVLPGARPNHFHYNTLISAYATSVEDNNNFNNSNNNDSSYADGNNGYYGSSVAADRAEQILIRMTEYVQPTTVSYNAVIDTLAKSGLAERAEALLRLMLNDNNDNNDNNMQQQQQQQQVQQQGILAPKPNTRSFNSVMNAWAKSKHDDSALRAEMLLELMQQRYEQGDVNVRPDVHSFCTVINAWARSNFKDKAERAKNLYREMEKLYKAGNKFVRPNIVAVNAVLNACAYTIGDDFRTSNRAMEIAQNIIMLLEKNVHVYNIVPDQITYGTFLKVVYNQMPNNSNTRDDICTVIFKKCCKNGQVSIFVLQQLQLLVNDELYYTLVDHTIQEPITTIIHQLPHSWTCNVNNNYIKSSSDDKRKWRK